MPRAISKRKKQCGFRLSEDVIDSLKKSSEEASDELREDYGEISMAAVLEASVRRVRAEIDAGELTFEELLTEDPSEP